jgi:hypothetical protein
MCSELALKSQATVPFQRTRISIKKAAEPLVQRKWPSTVYQKCGNTPINKDDPKYHLQIAEKPDIMERE